MTQKQSWIIGDCLDVLKSMPSNHFDIVIADPPYYKIKKDAWDNQWYSFQDYINWLEERCIEIKRVMKNSGSFYIFGDDQRIAYIQVMLDKHLTFLNHLVWYKRNNFSIKYAHNNRRFTPVSERILFYSLQDTTGLETIKNDINNFVSLRKYFKLFQDKLGLTKSEIINIVGQQADHCFRWNSSQWDLPTEQTYIQLCNLLSDRTNETSDRTNETKEYYELYNEYEDMRNEYEDMRNEYEDMRNEYEELRRPFNYTKGMYEVFDVPIINNSENTIHPTTKPIEVITRLIKSSMKEGSIVLDPFVGSGTTLEACMNLGLECVGIDISNEWVPVYKQRLKLNNSKLYDF